MKRAALVILILSLSAVVFAGSAHFVGTPTLVVVGDTVTTSGKVAGLGNVPQIHVVLSGDAACVNGGGNHPQAGNKVSFSVEGDFPVQNGKSLFALVMEATFQPVCNPPMSVQWSDVSILVTAVDGTFLTYP